jgi:hypothetical protein
MNGDPGKHLIDRLSAALQYADLSIPHLDHYSSYWSQKDTRGNRLKDKVIAETALLWYEASQLVDLPEGVLDLLQNLSSKLRMEASHEHNIVTILRAPHTVLWLGLAHILLSRLGVIDQDVDYIVQRALKGRYSIFAERVPFRQMDARWTRSVALQETPRFADILPQSIITSETHPIYMDRHDAYAITHTLMYITDFGRNDPPSSVDISAVQVLVDATIAWQIWNDDLDLLAELLLCYHFLRRPWSAYAKLAWDVLEFAWSYSPTLRGPHFSEDHFNTLSGKASEAYQFEYNYHTAYVGGLLCAALIRRPMHEPRTDQSTGNSIAPATIVAELTEKCQATSERLKSFLKARGECSICDADSEPDSPFDKTPNTASAVAMRVLRSAASPEDLQAHWVKAIDNSKIAAVQLASVLYDAALIKAVRRYDLAALVRTLSDIAYQQLPLTRTVVVSIDFLNTQLLPCGAVGAQFWRKDNQTAEDAVTITNILLKCFGRIYIYLSNSTAIF